MLQYLRGTFSGRGKLILFDNEFCPERHWTSAEETLVGKSCSQMTDPYSLLKEVTMSLPFRNTDKTPAIYPANNIVSIFEQIDDAEAALRDLDEHGFGQDVVYARDKEAQKLDKDKNEGLLAHIYRAMQSVMSDELPVIRLYEQKIAEGASFMLIPLTNSDEVEPVGKILKAHHVTLATYLGRTSFRSL